MARRASRRPAARAQLSSDARPPFPSSYKLTPHSAPSLCPTDRRPGTREVSELGWLGSGPSGEAQTLNQEPAGCSARHGGRPESPSWETGDDGSGLVWGWNALVWGVTLLSPPGHREPAE